jgi:hypothetical protein
MRADSGIKGVLTSIAVLVFLTNLCVADDAAWIDNTALKNAGRLAWLRNWPAASPYYWQVEREFVSSCDRRNIPTAYSASRFLLTNWLSDICEGQCAWSG